MKFTPKDITELAKTELAKQDIQKTTCIYIIQRYWNPIVVPFSLVVVMGSLCCCLIVLTTTKMLCNHYWTNSLHLYLCSTLFHKRPIVWWGPCTLHFLPLHLIDARLSIDLCIPYTLELLNAFVIPLHIQKNHTTNPFSDESIYKYHHVNR